MTREEKISAIVSMFSKLPPKAQKEGLIYISQKAKKYSHIPCQEPRREETLKA